jgi:hypothetical protein
LIAIASMNGVLVVRIVFIAPNARRKYFTNE